jgi:hypothetical protein
MLPRHLTPFTLLLVMLGMFWLGDACCDNLVDNAPAGATECLRCNADTPNKQHDATASFEHVVEFEKHDSAPQTPVFAFDAPARIPLRARQHTVRGPPSCFA